MSLKSAEMIKMSFLRFQIWAAQIDPSSGGKHQAIDFLMIVNIVCSLSTVGDIDVIVLPLNQAFFVEIKRLLRGVCDIGRGENDLQCAPRFSFFRPELNFLTFNPGL